jgi:hypothetical protein
VALRGAFIHKPSWVALAGLLRGPPGPGRHITSPGALFARHRRTSRRSGTASWRVPDYLLRSVGSRCPIDIRRHVRKGIEAGTRTVAASIPEVTWPVSRPDRAASRRAPITATAPSPSGGRAGGTTAGPAKLGGGNYIPAIVNRQTSGPSANRERPGYRLAAIYARSRGRLGGGAVPLARGDQNFPEAVPSTGGPGKGSTRNVRSFLLPVPRTGARESRGTGPSPSAGSPSPASPRRFAQQCDSRRVVALFSPTRREGGCPPLDVPAIPPYAVE